MKCPGGLLYAVRRGETFSSIARKTGVTVSELKEANPDVDPDRLDVGQIICVPGIAKEFCPTSNLYTVRRTDSMFTIARSESVSLSRLIRANPQVPDPDVIYPGEQLCIPKPVKPPEPPKCPDGIFYAARRRETGRSIADKFGISLEDLRRANPDVDLSRLDVGQVLCIPGVLDKICPGRRLYTVRRTDSMFTIARRESVSLSRLIRANPQVPDPDVIYPGEQLCIPRDHDNYDDDYKDCEDGLYYAARRRETGRSIARKFEISESKLERANPGVDLRRLQFGQILCIPHVAKKLCPHRRLHRVRRGETMFTIAKEYSVSVDDLVAANNWIPDPALIFPGEDLCIPKK